jgi:hypothetical protein
MLSPRWTERWLSHSITTLAKALCMFEELHAQPMAVHCHQDNWSSQGHNKAIIPAQRTIPSLSQKGTNIAQKTTCFIIPLRVQKHQNKKKSKQNPEGALQCLSSSVLYGSILFNPIFRCKRPMQDPCPQLVKTMLQNLVVATFLGHTKPKVLCYRLSLSLSLRALFFLLAESIDFCLFTSHCEWHPGSALQKAAEAWKEEWHTE